MCTICCKGRLADTASVCNASRTPRHARSAVGSKWALAAGSEKPLLAFVQGQQTLGRGLKRSATTRKRPQAFLCCLRPPANACTVALVLQRIHNAYTCLRIARRFYPQSLKKSTTNTRKGPQACFCTRPPADACAVAPSLQCIHSAYTCLHIVRSFYPHSLKEVLQTQGRDLKQVFAYARLQMRALRFLTYSAYTSVHIVRGFYPHSLEKSTTNTRKRPQTCFLPAPACKCEHCGSFLTLHTRACTSYDSSQREQAIAVLQQARFCHKCSFPL